MNKKLAIIGGSIIGVILLAAIVLFTVNQAQQIQAHNAEVAEINKKEKTFNDSYQVFKNESGLLNLYSDSIASGIREVWHKAIFDGEVSVDGKNYSEDNMEQAIQAKVDQLAYTMDNAGMSADRLQKQYGEMKQNLTTSNKDKYKNATQLYNDLMDFYHFATNDISGSYKEYTNSYNQLSTDVNTDLSAVGFKKK
jgi:hypothetical protein